MAVTGEIIVALAKSSVWGTAVSCNAANAGILLLDAPEFIAKPDAVADESMGFYYKEYIDATYVNANPTLEGFLRFTNNHWKLFAQVIGDDSAAIISGTEYTHTMDMQDDPALFLTLCLYDGVTVREIPSYKPSGFTLNQQDGFWKFSVRGTGSNVLLSGQTNTTLGSVTARTKTLRAAYGATTVRINDQSGIALDSTLNIYPRSCEIVFNRNQPREDLANAVADGSGEFHTLEPQQDGMAMLEINLELPEYTAVTYAEDLGDETLKKMTVAIDGPLAAGANSYSATFSFPALRVTDATYGMGPGNRRIVETLKLEGLKAQAAPTGMTSITKLFRLAVVDQLATGYDL